MSLRSLHRKISPLLLVLLAISALTGLTYRLGKKWFGLDGDTGQWLMEIHTGEWIAYDFSPFYLLITGGGLLFLLASGVAMFLRANPKSTARRLHRCVGIMMLLPLATTALTGMVYAIGQHWVDFSEETYELLMSIHEGAWLGSAKVYYVLLVGAGLLASCVSGLWVLLPKKAAARQNSKAVAD